MPFIRYARDKRGYETTFVMHVYRPGSNGPGRPRVLYFFRSPSHAKVGRRPLDEETREALEHTHPDLSFDWYTLTRESHPLPPDARERSRDRRAGRSARPPQQRSAPRETPPPARVDDSVLARAVGAAEAARLRDRYAGLLQRIARRARTPEERDRLTERSQRLNPEDWPDEDAARAGIREREREWDAIAAELPQRRRGRRGGRRRQEGETGDARGTVSAAGDSDPDGPSGILTVRRNAYEGHDDNEMAEDQSADPGGRPRGGSEPDGGPGPGIPGDD